MTIDGLNLGMGTNKFYSGTGNVVPTSTPPGFQDVVNLITDLEQLLNASKLLDGQNKPPTDLLKPPPEGVDNTKALANLSSLSDTQVTADIYAFMALFQKLAQQMRDTARTQRTTDLQAQVSSLQNAAEKMKDAAAQRLTAAIVQGAMQIAGGALQMGMSGLSAKQSIKGAQLEAQGKNNLATLKEFDGSKALPDKMQSSLTQSANNMVKDGQIASTRGTLYQGMGQSANSIAGGLGGIIGASFTNKADLAEADKMNLETQAKVHETGVQHANDMMQQMMDVIRDVRDKLQSIQQAAVETNRGIARNI